MIAESVLMAGLSWPEFARRIEGGAPVFIPVGATEQHGWHLPLGVDAVIPGWICAEVAKECGGMVAPAIAYGNRSQPLSGDGPAFLGTINITAMTIAWLLRDIITELYRDGARHMVVINGHYENVWPSVEGIELALDRIGRDPASGLKILRIDHWELVRTEILARVFPDGYPGIELEHASVIETSIMLKVRPELVALSEALNDGRARFKPYESFLGPITEVPPSGVLSEARGSSAEKGEWLLADVVERVRRMVGEEFGQGTASAS